MDSQKPHDSQIQLIRKSPFVMETDDDDTSWYFEVDDARPGKTVSACIDARALLESLGEPRGEAPLLTCGCGVAECARIYDERFECGDGYVHWSLTYEGRPYSFFFDRDAYETGALRMLSEVYRTKTGWEFCFGCFFSYEQFKSAVDGFLAAKPSFRKLWDSLNADS